MILTQNLNKERVADGLPKPQPLVVLKMSSARHCRQPASADGRRLTEDDERQLQPERGQAEEQEGRDDAPEVAQPGAERHPEVPVDKAVSHEKRARGAKESDLEAAKKVSQGFAFLRP